MGRNGWLATKLLLTGWLLVGACPVQAKEEAKKFLEALRERGYFDTALDYIEWLRTSRFCPEEMKETLAYEAGITNLVASLASQDMKYRLQYLDKAREGFEKFLDDQPSHPLAAEARSQLGNILVERAKIKREQAERPTVSPEEKKKLLKEAQAYLEEAREVFGELERYFTNERLKYPKVIDPKWPEKKKQEFEDIVRNMAMARIYLATVEYELAQTFPKGSAAYKDQLFTASNKFREIYEKFKDWLAGMYARYWQARCNKELGDADGLKTAQQICKELASLPDDPKPFRDIKNKALILQLEMLRDAKKPEKIWERVAQWVETARPDEETSPDGLTIRFYGAQAGEELLQQQKDKKDPKLYNAVRDYYRFVARYEGPHQLEARLRLRELAEGQIQVTSYEEARDYGKAALDELQSADLEMRLSAAQGALDEKKRQELEQRIQNAQQDAKMYFTQALRLAAGLPLERRKEILDELNTLRYYLAYLHYLADELYEAAVLGEFLARRYPESGGARPAAKIALACWVKLRTMLPKEADRSFETAHMTSLAEYIAGRWKEAPEAEDAIVMLLRSAVADQDPKKALEYLNRLPEKSAKRPEAEVLVGQALWSAYVRSAGLPEEQRPSQAELEQMRQQAQHYLEEGVAGLRKQLTDPAQVDYTLASAVLSLAQIYVETGQSKKALEKLTDPQIGPLTLVQAKHPVTARGTFLAATYKTALRTYVAERQLEKAEEVMNTLEKIMAADPEGASKLTQLYISLGLELQQQLNRLQQERKAQEAKQVLEGFEVFLDRIVQRPDNSFNSLYWVAETLQSLGAGLDPGGTRPCPAEAKPYYEKAVTAFQKLLQQVDAELEKIDQQLQPLEEKLKQIQDASAKEAEEEKLQPLREKKAKQQSIRASILLRIARSLRRLGQYKEALRWITLLLQEKPMMVDAQVEAAYICQSWGTQEPKYYLYAIQGGLKAKRKDGQEFQLPIWGWGQLARRVQRWMMDSRMEQRQEEKQRLSDYFHEARYNLAVCRFEYAKTLSGERRKKALQMAEQDILIVYRLMPELGGPEWFGKYNDLLKRIQQSQGKPATGLPKTQASSPIPTASK